MHPTLKKSAVVVAAAAVVALAANGISYATTGQGLVGGHWNKTDATTTIHDTSPGPALRLVSHGKDEPSLELSSSARVPHLNASMLQGHYASDLASHALVFTAGGSHEGTFSGETAFALDVPPGMYDVSFSAAVVPSNGTPAEPAEVLCGVIGSGGFAPFALDDGQYVGTDVPVLLSADNAVRVPPGGAVLICEASSPTAQFALPTKASFVKLNTLSRHHAPIATTMKSQRLPSFMK
jgi:hypothetical protein